MKPSFKLIVAGGRDFNARTLMVEHINALMNNELKEFDVEIVSGMARGADMLAYTIATESGYTVHQFPADWNQYGKRAGYLRNEQMANHAQGLIAFWDGSSRGTQHMIDIATRKGLSVRVVHYNSPEFQPAGPDEGDALNIYQEKTNASNQ